VNYREQYHVKNYDKVQTLWDISNHVFPSLNQ